MKKKRDNLQGFGEHTNYLKQKNKVLIYEYYITDKDFVQVPKLKNFEIERSLFIMPKLEIEYRTKKQDKENYFKDSTYFTFAIKDRTTLISIAPSETRNLSDIVYGIEEELQDGYHLQKDEKFEIDEEIKFIMEYEEKEDRRMDNELYPYFRFIALNRNNPEKLNQLLRYVNGGVA